MRLTAKHFVIGAAALLVAVVAVFVEPRVASAPGAAPPSPPSISVEFTGGMTCTVKVFDEAEHNVPGRGRDALQPEPSACLDDVVSKLARGTDTLVIVTGRVDKRKMRLPRRRVYGDSLSLAYQRAIAVREALLDRYASSPGNRSNREGLATRIIPLVGGANNVGIQVSNARLADDRSVDVRVLAASASVVENSNQEQPDDSSVTMFSTGDKLTLLTLIVALSAYLAAVRQMMTERKIKLGDEKIELRDAKIELGDKKIELAEKKERNPLARAYNEDVDARITNLDQRIKDVDARMKGVDERIKRIELRFTLLLVGDAALILAALSLGLHIFYWSGEVALKFSVWLFTIAGVWLIASHFVEWIRTARQDRGSKPSTP